MPRSPFVAENTRVKIKIDREYDVDLNLHGLDCIEQSVGRSIGEINDEFYEAKSSKGGIRVGTLYRFLVGAVVSADPTFSGRADSVVPLGKVRELAGALMPAWNAAIIEVFGLEVDAVASDEKETEGPSPSTLAGQAGTSQGVPSLGPSASADSPPPALGG